MSYDATAVFYLLLLILFSLAACSPEPTPPQLSDNKLGVHLLLDDGRILGWQIDPARWQTAVED